jgi:hypothetical protein
VPHVVKALCYKSEGRRFIFQIGLLGFLIDLILPGDSATNKSECQGHLLGGVNGGLYLGLTTLLS